MIDLVLAIIFCILGVFTGVLTGLIPGLHVNNIAVILLSLSTLIISSFSFLTNYGFNQEFIFLLIAIYIISCSLSHTFLDCIPSTFLGAPDADTALSVLPAHNLLLEGKGYEAVSLSALGSYGAILFCFALLFPVRLVIGNPLFFYETLREIMLAVLVAITFLMIATEKGKIDDIKKINPQVAGMLFAIFVFFLSGIFGIILFEIPVESPIGLYSPVLFPALTGLFGISTLLDSLRNDPSIPEQEIKNIELDKNSKKQSIISATTGSLGGMLVSIIPGITSATGTVLAMNARGKTGDENTSDSNKKQTIVTLSAVNTACAFFVVMVLFVILRPRSGAVVAVAELITIQEWNNLLMPYNLSFLLIAVLLAGTLSYFLTLKFGKIFAKHFSKLPYKKMVKLTISFIVVMVFLFTGLFGLLILLVATTIGLLPITWGIRRSHCMGVLLLPIIIYFL